jgi:hypothetical protein
VNKQEDSRCHLHNSGSMTERTIWTGLRLFAQDRTEQVEVFALILIADIQGTWISVAMRP